MLNRIKLNKLNDRIMGLSFVLEITCYGIKISFTKESCGKSLSKQEMNYKKYLAQSKK